MISLFVHIIHYVFFRTYEFHLKHFIISKNKTSYRVISFSPQFKRFYHDKSRRKKSSLVWNGKIQTTITPDAKAYWCIIQYSYPYNTIDIVVVGHTRKTKDLSRFIGNSDLTERKKLVKDLLSFFLLSFAFFSVYPELRSKNMQK